MRLAHALGSQGARAWIGCRTAQSGGLRDVSRTRLGFPVHAKPPPIVSARAHSTWMKSRERARRTDARLDDAADDARRRARAVDAQGQQGRPDKGSADLGAVLQKVGHASPNGRACKGR